ncbi:MAG TPA: hypothetical protein VGQ83_02225 [Polyangia bacterium]|jgi:hypothetical protein
MTDIMLDTEDPDGLCVPVAVEGKCTEPFSEQIRAWIREANPAQKDLARLQPKKTRERDSAADVESCLLGATSQI